MDSRINLLISKNSARLDELIRQNAPYEKILKQSKKLDKFIVIAMKDINKEMKSSKWYEYSAYMRRYIDKSIPETSQTESRRIVNCFIKMARNINRAFILLKYQSFYLKVL